MLLAQDHVKASVIGTGRDQEEGVLEAVTEGQGEPKIEASAGLLLLGKAVWLGNGLHQAT